MGVHITPVGPRRQLPEKPRRSSCPILTSVGLTAGLDPELSLRIVDNFVPESPGYYRDRAPEFVLPIHRGYITTTTDRELPRALQRGFKERLAPVYEGEIEGGHLPMLEHPQRLRASIVDFQAGVGEG